MHQANITSTLDDNTKIRKPMFLHVKKKFKTRYAQHIVSFGIMDKWNTNVLVNAVLSLKYNATPHVIMCEIILKITTYVTRWNKCTLGSADRT